MSGAPAKPWGKTQLDGRDVQLFTLTASSGAQLRVCNYGATIVGLTLPDSAGRFDDVVLGFDDLASYELQDTYIGCAVGRVCSRIAGAQFRLADEVFHLPANNGAACLHGGPNGFYRYTWELVAARPTAVTMRHVSGDLDQGFPGELTAAVEYELLPVADGSTALSVRFGAWVADRATVVNLTSHVYFNLAGSGGSMRESMCDHVLEIAADRFVPVDEDNIPLGELRRVDGTPFDFRTPTRIGERIDADDEQLRIAAGYDHNMALRETPGHVPLNRGGTRALGVEPGPDGCWARSRAPDAVVAEPRSGRRLEVFTSEPAIHFYTGNYLGNTPLGKGGVAIERRAAFCLETQHLTNSPNEPSFPSVVLEPGEVWETRTVFWFPPPDAGG